MPFSDEEIRAAVRDFWGARETGTQSGRHDRAFLELVANELTELGWPAQIRQQSVVAGHFRVAKAWDIVCRDRNGHPRICIEFKSQVDSYGNNENNRYEEALGSGLDVRAHYGVPCQESETVSGVKRFELVGQSKSRQAESGVRKAIASCGRTSL